MRTRFHICLLTEAGAVARQKDREQRNHRSIALDYMHDVCTDNITLSTLIDYG
jgi:hypothetical protein